MLPALILNFLQVRCVLHDLTAVIILLKLLTIISPEDFHISENEFIIKKSKGLSWQWYYYGSEITDKNLMTYNYFIENKNTIISNPEKNIVNIKANENEPAFEIC